MAFVNKSGRDSSAFWFSVLFVGVDVSPVDSGEFFWGDVLGIDVSDSRCSTKCLSLLEVSSIHDTR